MASAVDMTSAVAESRFALLSEARRLAESMDSRTVLAGIVKMSIPHLADWASIDVVEDGVATRQEVAHRDGPELAEAAGAPVRYSQRQLP